MMTILLSVFALFTGPMTNLDQKEIVKAEFKVHGNCGMCGTRIEEAALIKGVRSASWSAETQTLTIQYNPAVVTPDEVKAKVSAVGHDTETTRANDKVYDKLPGCCQYSRPEHKDQN